MITHNVHGVHVRIILDLTRNPGEDIRSITDWAKSLPQEVFVGVGVSGGEGSIPRPEYAPYTSALKASGFRLTVHAGELEGPESVREALDVLEADRIGHGVRSWEDAALLARLAAEQVHLEVCPAANRVIGISAPPLRSMLDAGINLSINTDDETVFGTDLECECAALVARHELTVADCVSLFTSAATSSFDAAAATAAMSNATLKP
jgi:aminodeoxyfutalosine deaminase